MNRIRNLMTISALTLILAATGLSVAQQSSEAALRAAIEIEMTRGLNAAIEQYKKVVDSYRRSAPATAAQALLRMAQAYEKIGNAQAASVYAQIVQDFSSQKEPVAKAQERLATLRSASTSTGGITVKRVLSEGGTVSQDGKWVLQADSNIAVYDLASGSKRFLVKGAAGDRSYAESARLSPDGREVAYLWIEPSEPEVQVRVVPFGGEAVPRVVHRSRNYVHVKGWAPDGRNLLVSRRLDDRTWQIAMLSVADGAIRQLKSLSWTNPGASISPDGRYIAYDTPVGDGTVRDIFVLAADGSQEAPVVQHSADDHSTIWSPDSSRILFVSNRTATPSLWSVPVKDGKASGPVELVRADIGAIVPSTMTKTGTLYYSVASLGHRNIYRARLGEDGKISGYPEVATDNYVNSNWGASLSVDGRKLAYYSDRREGTVLVVRDLSTGRERVYSLNQGISTLYFNGPGWLPDGRSLLVDGGESVRPGAYLYRVDLETGTTERLVTSDAGFKVSPDGKFVVSQGGRLDLATGQVTALREGPRPSETHVLSPAISRDGKQVAYVLAGQQGVEILVTDAQGGESRRIFSSEKLGNPFNMNPFNILAWTPDGRHILVPREEQSAFTIWRVPVAGGQPEPVGGPMKVRIKGIQVHPDGRTIFFTGIAGSSEIWALENFLPALSAR